MELHGNNGGTIVDKSQDSHWMAYAIEQAHKAQEMDEVPVGAVIVKSNKIIGEGCNQVITLNDASAHAEIIALRNTGNNIQNYRIVETTLYVTLEPCMMCVGALVHARVKRVVFGAFDKKTGVATSNDNCFSKSYHNHKISIRGGVLEDKCGTLLSQFFKNKRQLKKNNRTV